MAQAPTACQTAPCGNGGALLGARMTTEPPEVTEPFAERHYTVNELASM